MTNSLVAQYSGIRNIADARDFTDTTGAGTDQYSIVWDNGTSKFILVDRQDAAIDHGSLAGLADDDHTQYILADGTRAGASSSSQSFDGTNGVTVGNTIVTSDVITIGQAIRPDGDATNAIIIQNSAGTSNLITVDSTNQKVIYANSANSRTFSFDTSNSAWDSSDHLQLNRFSAKIIAVGNSSDSRLYVGQHAAVTPAVAAKMAVGNESTSIDALAIGGPRSGTPTGHLLHIGNYFESGFPYTLNTTLLVVDKDGNLGLNDSSPSYLLDVNGDANITGDLRIAQVIKPDGDATNAIIIQNAAGTSDLMTFDATNLRVGINDSTPSYDLDVNGDCQLCQNTSDLLGFHGSTPLAQQTVSGSTAGNAALQDLLTKLDTLGLINDTTT